MKRWLIIFSVALVAFVGLVCFEVATKGSNRTLFVKRFFTAPRAVGSLVPSSPRLAEAIVSFLPEGKERRVLEIGPGTGSFTEAIVAQLGPSDHLDLVEIDPAFCQALQERFGSDPRIAIHQVSILDWSPPYLYDGVISGLPLNAFSPDQVEQILKHYEALMESTGTLAYFEYVGIPEVQRTCLLGKAARHAQAVQKLKAEFFQEYGEGQQIVWLNVPPARVCYCRNTS